MIMGWESHRRVVVVVYIYIWRELCGLRGKGRKGAGVGVLQ